jgi:glycine/D-amino acid oxidase-like deaminating enzyme
MRWPEVRTMSKGSEIIVIGGGVIGTSVAYYAAKAGHRVTLVEKGDVAAGTSGACDGFIILQSKNPGPHLELALQSAAMYRTLSAELDYDIEYRPCGGMVVVENEKQADLLRGLIEKQKAAGLEVELLPIAEARRSETLLAEDLWGAAYCADDAQANPIRVAQGFAQAARRLGANIRSGVEVKELLVENGRVCGVKTSEGDLRADFVVNAAGVWAPDLLAPLGINVPIKPRRGQILVTEPLPSMLKHVLLCACYLTAKYHPEELDLSDRQHRLGVGLAVEQTAHGGLLIGSTREFAGFDRRTTLAGIEAVARHARRILPALANVNIIRTFAGLRPHTPDGLPILGPVEGLPGLIMAAGHEGDGIALAPVTGKKVAEFIQ